MGCGVSRLDGNGITFLPQLRPIFLHRLEEIKTRRHNIGPDSTPSKKELLLQDMDEDCNTSSCGENDKKSIPSSSQNGVSRGEEPEGLKKNEPGKPATRDDQKDGVGANNEAKVDDVLTDHVDDDDDENDDDGRTIGREEDGAYPGSPSFRVFFRDTTKYNQKSIDKDDASKDALSDDTESSKESLEKKKKTKRGRRNFRKVLPKGGQSAVKNLLNVKSCYSCQSPDQLRKKTL